MYSSYLQNNHLSAYITEVVSIDHNRCTVRYVQHLNIRRCLVCHWGGTAGSQGVPRWVTGGCTGVSLVGACWVTGVPSGAMLL
jgi:hypothetical protein